MKAKYTNDDKYKTKFTIVSIEFKITADNIEKAIGDLLHNKEAITKSKVIKHIKAHLYQSGVHDWGYLTPEDEQRKAHEIAMKLFPDFY